MPSAPYVVYRKTNEWEGWGGFLNTGTKHNKDKILLDYESAKIIVSKLKLKNYSYWENYISCNGLIKGIPRHPQRYYKKKGEWLSWGDFLGT